MTGLILGREMERSLFNQDCSFLTGSSAVSQRQSGAREERWSWSPETTRSLTCCWTFDVLLLPTSMSSSVKWGNRISVSVIPFFQIWSRDLSPLWCPLSQVPMIRNQSCCQWNGTVIKTSMSSDMSPRMGPESSLWRLSPWRTAWSSMCWWVCSHKESDVGNGP